MILLFLSYCRFEGARAARTVALRYHGEWLCDCPGFTYHVKLEECRQEVKTETLSNQDGSMNLCLWSSLRLRSPAPPTSRLERLNLWKKSREQALRAGKNDA